MIAAAATGFASGLSLILAIGAQNAFVLRQGLMGQHVFWVCLLCAASDAVLITVGVAGFGYLVANWPALPQLMAWGGAAFLSTYGLLRFLAAWRGDYDLQIAGRSSALLPTLATAAAFTWLNPHVYLDTLGLIGAISTQFTMPALKWAFGAGAVTASFVFFFSLGYGAGFLTPIMQSARAWRLLDTLIGLVMWGLALKLII